MSTIWIAVISGVKTFVLAAAAQIALMLSQGVDPWDKYMVWVIAGILALVKGGSKAVEIKAVNGKVLVPKSDVCPPRE